MLIKRKKSGLEAKRVRWGYTFVAHWGIGLIMFFAIPLISSIWYSFNNVSIQPGEIITTSKGLEHYATILKTDPNYVNNLRDSIGMMFYSLPTILALSLVFAMLLNQQFRGRTVMRAIFFLPVIFSSSVVMAFMSGKGQYVNMPLMNGTDVIDYKAILSEINMPEFISTILEFLLSRTTSLLWSSGVQTILFLAGLQSIPASFYEASKIEGANKWEEFWMITVPSLRHIMLLVTVYTMIELFTNVDNKVVSVAYDLMVGQNYGESSAMLWFYFVIVLGVMGIVMALYNHFCMKRWE